MAKRRGGKKMKRGFKKCIVNAMKGTKFTTALQARKAFARASKKCSKLMRATRAARKGKRKARRGKRKAKRRSYRGRYKLQPSMVGAYLQSPEVRRAMRKFRV